MTTTLKPGAPGRARSAGTATSPTLSSLTIDELAETINRAIEQAEQLGISSVAQLLMMARLEVDLTELALARKATR